MLFMCSTRTIRRVPRWQPPSHTGAHPVAVLLPRDQKPAVRRQFARATRSRSSIPPTIKVIDTILLRPSDGPRSARRYANCAWRCPPDEKTLYVALGDMNAIAVIDVDDSELARLHPRRLVSQRAWPSPPMANGCSSPTPRAPTFAIPTTSPTRTIPERKHEYVLTVLEGNVIADRHSHRRTILKTATR